MQYIFKTFKTSISIYLSLKLNKMKIIYEHIKKKNIFDTYIF